MTERTCYLLWTRVKLAAGSWGWMRRATGHPSQALLLENRFWNGFYTLHCHEISSIYSAIIWYPSSLCFVVIQSMLRCLLYNVVIAAHVSLGLIVKLACFSHQAMLLWNQICNVFWTLHFLCLIILRNKNLVNMCNIKLFSFLCRSILIIKHDSISLVDTNGPLKHKLWESNVPPYRVWNASCYNTPTV